MSPAAAMTVTRITSGGIADPGFNTTGTADQEA
jgi:hypothetical protein